MPVSTVLVPYFACTNCGFVFTNHMDNWTAEDFQRNIYNNDYAMIDPPIPGRVNVLLQETPSYLMGLHIARHFEGSQNRIRILDYGAGGDPGPTGQALMDSGFMVDSYEPYRANCRNPEGKYDLIICIEVLEHCHDLGRLREFFPEHLSMDGLIWIQTLLHPHPTPERILDSWYIAPRNGHISIHTLWSLTLLFNSMGMNLAVMAQGTFAFGAFRPFQTAYS